MDREHKVLLEGEVVRHMVQEPLLMDKEHFVESLDMASELDTCWGLLVVLGYNWDTVPLLVLLEATHLKGMEVRHMACFVVVDSEAARMDKALLLRWERSDKGELLGLVDHKGFLHSD